MKAKEPETFEFDYTREMDFILQKYRGQTVEKTKIIDAGIPKEVTDTLPDTLNTIEYLEFWGKLRKDFNLVEVQVEGKPHKVVWQI